MVITVSSPAFQEGGPIPRAHPCDGEDVSPPLRWQGVPERARSLALICEDANAPRGSLIHLFICDDGYLQTGRGR
jgi:phosphatidylethanolamine-binding protein (PEBP) family uncharacterized protein